MKEDYKFAVQETALFLNIRLIDAEYAIKNVVINNSSLFLNYRIERAKKYLAKKEDLYKKHFKKLEDYAG